MGQDHQLGRFDFKVAPYIRKEDRIRCRSSITGLFHPGQGHARHDHDAGELERNGQGSTGGAGQVG
jgi:hypothetical protein